MRPATSNDGISTVDTWLVWLGFQVSEVEFPHQTYRFKRAIGTNAVFFGNCDLSILSPASFVLLDSLISTRAPSPCDCSYIKRRVCSSSPLRPQTTTDISRPLISVPSKSSSFSPSFLLFYITSFSVSFHLAVMPNVNLNSATIRRLFYSRHSSSGPLAPTVRELRAAASVSDSSDVIGEKSP